MWVYFPFVFVWFLQDLKGYLWSEYKQKSSSTNNIFYTCDSYHTWNNRLVYEQTDKS